MKLTQYAEKINRLVDELGPDADDTDVFYSSDDEGNAYNPVVIDPSIMLMDENEDIIVEDDDIELEGVHKVVCIN